MKLGSLVVALGLAVLPVAARAGVDDIFAGERSYAMGGAHRGVGMSNDTLYLNPAGMVLAKRYSVELQYGYTRADELSWFNFSAVDSGSGPVAGGFGFTHVRGGKDLDAGLNHFYLGAAYPLADAIAMGLSLHHLRGRYEIPLRRQGVNLYTGDVGLMVSLAEGVTLGVAYNNVIETDQPALTPPTLGAGLGVSVANLTLAADVTLGIDDARERGVSYHAGAEYFVADVAAVRVGYGRQPSPRASGGYRDENLLSAGVGWLTRGGAIEIAARRSLERNGNWGLIGAIKFFL